MVVVKGMEGSEENANGKTLPASFSFLIKQSLSIIINFSIGTPP